MFRRSRWAPPTSEIDPRILALINNENKRKAFWRCAWSISIVTVGNFLCLFNQFSVTDVPDGTAIRPMALGGADCYWTVVTPLAAIPLAVGAIKAGEQKWHWIVGIAAIVLSFGPVFSSYFVFNWLVSVRHLRILP